MLEKDSALAEVMLAYTVPVVAMVGVETGELTRVIGVDEEIRPGSDLADPATAEASRIAEEVDWPPWEFGF